MVVHSVAIFDLPDFVVAAGTVKIKLNRQNLNYIRNKFIVFMQTPKSIVNGKTLCLRFGVIKLQKVGKFKCLQTIFPIDKITVSALTSLRMLRHFKAILYSSHPT